MSSCALGRPWNSAKANQTEALLDRQLGLGLANVQSDTLCRVTIAYEPVWAIGNAQHHATPQQAQEAHAVLRARFGEIFGKAAADAVSIQYGGSVVPHDAAALLSRPGVDGALIGGASLIADEFLAIARSAITETKRGKHPKIAAPALVVGPPISGENAEPLTRIEAARQGLLNASLRHFP
jgi:triosephosphate isomerase (TIM)